MIEFPKKVSREIILLTREEARSNTDAFGHKLLGVLRRSFHRATRPPLADYAKPMTRCFARSMVRERARIRAIS
jgi:hypothetical protein